MDKQKLIQKIECALKAVEDCYGVCEDLNCAKCSNDALKLTNEIINTTAEAFGNYIKAELTKRKNLSYQWANESGDDLYYGEAREADNIINVLPVYVRDFLNGLK